MNHKGGSVVVCLKIHQKRSLSFQWIKLFKYKLIQGCNAVAAETCKLFIWKSLFSLQQLFKIVWLFNDFFLARSKCLPLRAKRTKPCLFRLFCFRHFSYLAIRLVRFSKCFQIVSKISLIKMMKMTRYQSKFQVF